MLQLECQQTRTREAMQAEARCYQLAKRIASMLGENQTTGADQIKLLLQALGRECVFELLRETLRIEQKGGMRTCDGKRRRTPGGVFFLLARRYRAEVWSWLHK